MFKRLIDALTLDYTYVAKARGIMSSEELMAFATCANTKKKLAPRVLVPEGMKPAKDDELDLTECEMITDHIQQMAEWIEQLRITEII